jgi:polar amino acid transport system substrate-binding protein
MNTAISTTPRRRTSLSIIATVLVIFRCARRSVGAFLLSALISWTWADNSQAAQIADYTVAVEAIDYMPLYSGAGQNSYRGYARDLLDFFGRKFGYRFHYVALPVNRLYKEFFTAQNMDFKFPDNPNWQPDSKSGMKVIYSEPVITVTEGLFLPAARIGQRENDIKSIATITGFTPTPYLAAITSGKIRLYSVDSFQSLFTMSTIDRVDAIYTNSLAVQYYQSAQGSSNQHLRMDRNLPSIASDFSLATLKHPEVIAQFNHFMQDDQAEIMQLKKKYGITTLID